MHAHMRGDGAVSVGAVVRDHNGKILVAAVRRCKANWKLMRLCLG